MLASLVLDTLLDNVADDVPCMDDESSVEDVTIRLDGRDVVGGVVEAAVVIVEDGVVGAVVFEGVGVELEDTGAVLDADETPVV